MVKKALAGVVGTLFLGVVLYGTSFFGYMKTAKDEIQRAADDAVPLEFKMADAERMVKELDPEIKRVMTIVARQQVDGDLLSKKIAQKESDLKNAKGQILALKSELDKGEKEYVFEGQSYTANDVRNDLDTKFNAYKREVETLNGQKDLLKRHKDALSLNENRLSEMIAAKKDLESQMETLRGRVETEKAAQALGKSEIVDSNSKMARARKVIEDINRKLDVNDKLRAQEERVATGIRVPEKKETQNVSQEIEEFFGDDAKPKTDL